MGSDEVCIAMMRLPILSLETAYVNNAGLREGRVWRWTLRKMVHNHLNRFERARADTS